MKTFQRYLSSMNKGKVEALDSVLWTYLLVTLTIYLQSFSRTSAKLVATSTNLTRYWITSETFRGSFPMAIFHSTFFCSENRHFKAVRRKHARDFCSSCYIKRPQNIQSLQSHKSTTTTTKDVLHPQQNTTRSSLAVIQAGLNQLPGTSDVKSRTVFAGEIIASISGCHFQIFNAGSLMVQ